MLNMKLILTILLTLTIWSLEAQSVEFELTDCRTGFFIQIKKDSLFFVKHSLESIRYDTLVSKKDLERLNILFQDILKKKRNEVWINQCIRCGVDLKFIISQNRISKKVFVSNYFDQRLNEIALIVNNYLHEFETTYIIIFPYGTLNEHIINQDIESQNNCGKISKKEKKSLLKWCFEP